MARIVLTMLLLTVGAVNGRSAEPHRPIDWSDLRNIQVVDWSTTSYTDVEFTRWGHTRWDDWWGFWRLDGDVLVLIGVQPLCEWRVPLTRGPKGMLTGVCDRGVDVRILPR